MAYGVSTRNPSSSDIDLESTQFLRMGDFKVGCDIVVHGDLESRDSGGSTAIWVGMIKSFVDVKTTLLPDPVPIVTVQWYDFAESVGESQENSGLVFLKELSYLNAVYGPSMLQRVHIRRLDDLFVYSPWNDAHV